LTPASPYDNVSIRQCNEMFELISMHNWLHEHNWLMQVAWKFSNWQKLDHQNINN
jgi:hypothetical protein